MTQVTATSVDACPRCQKPLVDPAGLGWCKACGYCRSVEESERSAAATPQAGPAAQNSLTATGSALVRTPAWIWVMFAGAAVLAAATWACGRWFTFSPFERALLTTLQIAAGFGMMFVGQLIGLLRIAPDEPSLNFWDALFPFRLYGLIFKRLPSTRHTVYLGAWGLVAIACAAFFIGGLGHWFHYLPGNQKNATQKTKK